MSKKLGGQKVEGSWVSSEPLVSFLKAAKWTDRNESEVLVISHQGNSFGSCLWMNFETEKSTSFGCLLWKLIRHIWCVLARNGALAGVFVVTLFLYMDPVPFTPTFSHSSFPETVGDTFKY